MTDITFYYNNEKFIGLKAEGHSGFAKKNEDIVCASISLLLQSSITALKKVLKIKLKIKKKVAFLNI